MVVYLVIECFFPRVKCVIICIGCCESMYRQRSVYCFVSRAPELLIGVCVCVRVCAHVCTRTFVWLCAQTCSMYEAVCLPCSLQGVIMLFRGGTKCPQWSLLLCQLFCVSCSRVLGIWPLCPHPPLTVISPLSYSDSFLRYFPPPSTTHAVYSLIQTGHLSHPINMDEGFNVFVKVSV